MIGSEELTERWNGHKSATVVFAVNLVVPAAAALGGTLIPETAYQPVFGRTNPPPGVGGLFGIDWLGRDMLARTMKGLSINIWIGLLASVVGSVVALLLDIGAAVLGGWFDHFVLWLTDLMQGMPHLILLILIAILSGRGITGVTVGVAVTHRVSLCRIVRAETIHLRTSAYVVASRQMGRSRWLIAANHYTPYTPPQMIVTTVSMFPHAILHKSGLTFLGLGIPQQLSAIGVILFESMRYLSTGQWWLALFLGSTLLVLVLLIGCCGQPLSTLISPRTSQRQAQMPLLEVRNLYVGFAMYHTFYQRRTGYGVEDLTLTAGPGETLRIVGASGSGESLLVHAIMNLLPRNAVKHGEILFKGEPVTGKRVLEFRRESFAFVPQSISFLDPLLRVKHQLRTGPTPDEEELAHIAEHLDLSPCDLEKYPFQLSGGMARRAFLATAIPSPAELIVVDEPTPGLSVELAEQLLTDFRSPADQGRCMLIISHDVDLISAIADRVAVLNRGRLVACMPTHEFIHPDDFDQPPYAKALWKALSQNELCTETPDSREELTRADS